MLTGNTKQACSIVSRYEGGAFQTKISYVDVSRFEIRLKSVGFSIMGA